MAKKKTELKGRVVFISKEDNLKLKQYFVDAEKMGITLSNAEILTQIFRRGLYAIINDVKSLEQ